MHIRSISTLFILALGSALNLLTGCGGAGNNRSSDDELGLAFFLDQVTDVAAIAEPPLGTAELTSSYDRSGGNQDWGNYNVPAQSDGLVDVATFEGPGVIHRFWCTGQYPNIWSFYFDGEKQPRFLGRDFYAEPETSTHKAFAAFDTLATGGYKSYLPIPFEKSLRIAVPQGSKIQKPYFQFNWNRLPKGSNVSSFPKNITPELLSKVHAASQMLTNRTVFAEVVNGSKRTVDIQAQGVTPLLQTEGEGTLRSFGIRPDWPAGLSVTERHRTLRELRLVVSYSAKEGGANSEKMPSINVPFGDFFMNAFSVRDYTSFTTSVADGWFMSRFPMPFTAGMNIDLANDSAMNLRAETVFNVVETKKPEARLLHAAWAHSDRPKRALPQEHIALRTKGKGHLAGCYLNTIGYERNWFILEGDDLIRRDGEGIPSLNGTGLEDYFNGAWYYYGLSDRPFAGLLQKAAMRTSQYRIHGPDRIGFNEELDFRFEFGHVLGSGAAPNSSRAYISSTTYWYQDTPSAVPEPPPTSHRFPSKDPNGPAKEMAGLLELERIGHWEEARDRCLELADQYKGTAISAIMTLRAFETDRILGTATEDPATRYKTLRLDPTMQSARANSSILKKGLQDGYSILHLNSSTAVRALVKGRTIGHASNPRHLSSFALPSPKELVLEVTAARAGLPWVNCTLQTGTNRTAVLTDWEYATEANAPDTAWRDVKDTAIAYHPKLESWDLSPNAFPGTQSNGMIHLSPKTYAPGTKGVFYLRKRF